LLLRVRVRVKKGKEDRARRGIRREEEGEGRRE
jgi:hypothetical protein